MKLPETIRQLLKKGSVQAIIGLSLTFATIGFTAKGIISGDQFFELAKYATIFFLGAQAVKQAGRQD